MKSFDAVFPAVKEGFFLEYHELMLTLHRDLLSSIDRLPLSDCHRLARPFWDSCSSVQNIIDGRLQDQDVQTADLISSVSASAVAQGVGVQRVVCAAAFEEKISKQLSTLYSCAAMPKILWP